MHKSTKNKFYYYQSFGRPFLVFLSSLTFSTISPSFKSVIGTSAFNSSFLPGIKMILLGKREIQIWLLSYLSYSLDPSYLCAFPFLLFRRCLLLQLHNFRRSVPINCISPKSYHFSLGNCFMEGFIFSYSLTVYIRRKQSAMLQITMQKQKQMTKMN